MLRSFELCLCEWNVEYSAVDELVDLLWCLFDITRTARTTSDENISERLWHLLAILLLEGSKIVGHDMVDIDANWMSVSCRECDKWIHVTPSVVVRW